MLIHALGLALAALSPVPQEAWSTLALPALCEPAVLDRTPLERLERGYHLDWHGYRQEVAARPPVARLEPGTLASLLSDEAAREESELRFFGEAPPLLVRGDAAALERARATVADLQALSQSLEVELRAYWVPKAAAPAAWLDDGAARALIGAQPELGTARVRSGASVDLGVRRTRSFLASFDVEVASDANAAEPRIGRVHSGRTLHLRACRVEGGRAVHVAGLFDHAQERETQRFEPKSSDLGVLQQPTVDSVQVAFSGKIPSGGWLTVSVAGRGALDGVVLVQATTQPDPAAPARWRGFDVALLESPVSEWPMPEPETDGLLDEESEPLQHRPALATSTLAQGAEGLLRVGKRSKLSSLSRSSSPSPTWMPGLLLLPVAEADACAEVEQLARAALAERARTHELVVRHGELVVRGPASQGGWLRVLAVSERSVLADYALEIAQEAWIPQPQLRRVLTGFALEGVVHDGVFVARAWRASGGVGETLSRAEANLGALELLDRAQARATARVVGEPREVLSADGALPALSVQLSPAR
jgi:hypothetical protein